MTHHHPDPSNSYTNLSDILENLEELGVMIVCPGDPSMEADQQMLSLRVEGLADSVKPILPITKIPPHKFPVTIVSEDGEHILTIENDVTNSSVPYRLIILDAALDQIWRDEAEEALYQEEVDDRIERGLDPCRFPASPEDIEKMKQIEREAGEQLRELLSDEEE